ncbi:PQQ-binding-like beta-propeller repeat protein [bacterium]|nr:PQQ-binding-like beta-propeller repeat protein [bacterium]
MKRWLLCWPLLLAFLTATPSLVSAGPFRLVTQGNGKLAIVDKEGKIEWQMPWGGIHDIHVLDNGHIMVQKLPSKVVEIDPATKKVVWSYDSSKSNGNEGKRIEVHAFQPLANGNVMIAESGAGRIIEVDRDGKLLKEMKLKLDSPHPHSDTRLVRQLENGNYLVAHENDGFIREYDGKSGKVVWEYEVPMFGKQPAGGHGPEAYGNKAFAAVRLENGNTLIATGNGHSVIEVTPEKEIVWKIAQNDLPGITLAWVTTLEVLPNGHYVVGNCHAGPGNPLLVEIDPKTKKVVWQFDQFDTFGNSVPNSQLLEIEGDVRR